MGKPVRLFVCETFANLHSKYGRGVSRRRPRRISLQMCQKPRKRYTTEIKAKAVDLLDTGKPVPQVAEELCISSALLRSMK
jgi:transposase-like protein